MVLTWIEGPARSGKTTALITQVAQWGEALALQPGQGEILMMAANGDTRLALDDRLLATLPPTLPITTATPTGFCFNEVALYWPLVATALGLSPQSPLRLRPEKEQELALALWQGDLAGPLGQLGGQGGGWTPVQTVRRCLDFLTLAAAAAMPLGAVGDTLAAGMPPEIAPPEVWAAVGQALERWQDWCLQRGLLTYGLAMAVYHQHLLPHPTYRQGWGDRFRGLGLDDWDEYPALIGSVVALAQEQGQPVAMTWNLQGWVRLGVGADPVALEGLRAEATEVISLKPTPTASLAPQWADSLTAQVLDPFTLPKEIPPLTVIQTISRGELLRDTATAIATAIQAHQITPQEVAIVGPGLDAIARYTLGEILNHHQIPVTSLQDHRPLVASPLVRALLTLLPLVYPGLGHHLDGASVAELLVILSPNPTADGPWPDRSAIDPIRAELIVDHCFQPDPDQPQLLPVTEFPRWDRLGHRATEAYRTLRHWIEGQRQEYHQRLLTSPVSLLDRAIQKFLPPGTTLPHAHLAALRELLETAQHFWAVESRLGLGEGGAGRSPVASLAGQPPGRGREARVMAKGQSETIARFLTLLYQGTVTANPYPVPPPGGGGVTLATVFQYRSQRLCHRWQFWLDAGSPRWLTGSDALLGYPLFLHHWDGQPWSISTLEAAHEARLSRILPDLLGRTTERVILCHSDLAVSGEEQAGPLLSLIHTARPYDCALAGLVTSAC